MANLVAFLASGFWGYIADIFGRRWAMIIPAAMIEGLGLLALVIERSR